MNMVIWLLWGQFENHKRKSLYCHPSCTYTVGEEINIYVSFDRPIVVLGNDVSLAMNVGHGEKDIRALYVPSMSTENELVFQYTVGHEDSSTGASLNYICTESLCSLQLGGATEIKGATSIPTSDADLTLPPCSETGLSGDESNPVIIESSGRPSVIDVLGNTPDGKFGPGDVIEILVHFSRTVSARPRSFALA